MAEESRRWRMIIKPSVRGALRNGEGERWYEGWEKDKNT